MEAKRAKRERRSQISSEPLQVPFRVLVDGREKAPYQFHQLRGDAVIGHRPLVVPWQWAHLKTGDYSLEGCKGKIAIERKSLEDLFSTLGQNRDRFEAEHERLVELEFAAVVIEASLEDVLRRPPERSQLLPKTVYRTFLSWTIRYGVPWIFAGGRRLGEVTTYRLLEHWWHELQDKLGETSSHCRICGRPLKSDLSYARGMGPVCAARGDHELALVLKNGGVV